MFGSYDFEKMSFLPVNNWSGKILLSKDFDIFLLFNVNILVWIQNLAGCFPLYPTAWAISQSWWGNFKSIPPPWISNSSPRYLLLIAVHSRCHPGNPKLQGEFHFIRWFLSAFFHKAKSNSLILSPWLLRFLELDLILSKSLPDNFP